MRGGTFRYLSLQGIESLLKNKLMTFASVGVLASCLFLTGAALVLSVNVDSIIEYAEEQNEIVVFMKDLDEDEARAAKNKIEATPGVTSVEFVSKEQGLDNVKEDLEGLGSLFEGLEEDNPLPDSYKIKISSKTSLSETVKTLEGISGVEQVNAPTNLSETLKQVRKTVLLFAIIVVSVLIAVTMVVIGNTIKLTVFARSREINIMKQVGATNAFIRFPFLVEGSMLGLLSAAFSFLAVWGVYSYVLYISKTGDTTFTSAIVNNLVPFSALWYWVLSMFVLIGVITGIVSTILSVRKHLKV